MRCPSCGSDDPDGVEGGCPRCGRAGASVRAAVGAVPQEYVVRIPTGLVRMEAHRPMVHPAVKILYGAGLAGWCMPLVLGVYYSVDALTATSVGWRALGMVLAVLLAVLVHIFCWAGAFFYGRLVTSDQIAQEAERATFRG